MEFLKLAALDEEDLQVISACMQDAVVKAGEIAYSSQTEKLVLTVNRFVWEKAGERLAVPERRRAVLHFNQATKLKSVGIDRKKPETVLSILAIQPVEGNLQALQILFAGGATLKFDVESIDAQLADMGSAWAAKAKPKHEV